MGCFIFDGTTTSSVVSTVSILDGSFHHVACTKDATQIQLYVNGGFNNATANQTPLGLLATAHNLVFGTTSNLTSSPFSGYLDDISFYSTALPAGVIAAHYHFGKD